MLHQEVRTFDNASYQEFVSQLGNTPVVYHRTGRPDQLTWNGWQRKFDTGNILGTVSQSGGVPTGAIIERGSNSDGIYTLFADGTMLIRISGVTSSAGYKDIDLAFPASDLTYSMSVSMVSTSNSALTTKHSGISSTGFVLWFIKVNQAGGSDYLTISDVIYRGMILAQW
jgi:hypothetical protein